MNKQLLRDAFGWGFVLWLIGYALGIMLFIVVPISMIGWIIIPIGTSITAWVLVKKIRGTSMRHYALVAIAWTLIAMTLDYVFLVKAFKPADGYYKLDVYIYYALTFTLPILIGWRKKGTSR